MSASLFRRGAGTGNGGVRANYSATARFRSRSRAAADAGIPLQRSFATVLDTIRPTLYKAPRSSRGLAAAGAAPR